MKLFTSTFLLVILAGCSPEDTISDASGNDENAYKKKMALSAGNPSNNYDYTGVLYLELLESHYKSTQPALTLQQLIGHGEALASVNPGFLALDDFMAYQPISVADVMPYLTADGQDIENFLTDSFGPVAVTFIEEITTQLSLLKAADASYAQVHASMIEIEASITARQGLPDDERAALLITTSILRYALYHDGKRKRRDRDWEWMTGHIAATANAALDSKPQAILMSFSIDVYQD